MPKKKSMPMKTPLKDAPFCKEVDVPCDVSTSLMEPTYIAQPDEKRYTSRRQASGESVGRHRTEEYVTHFTADVVLRFVSATKMEPFTMMHK